MFQRHPIQNDHTMFITTNTKDRVPIFQHPACAREAIETLYRIREYYPFLLFGFVIMPDHCHFLLHIESPRMVSALMRKWKMGVSTNIAVGPIWQSRFHMLLPDDSYRVLHYIRENPVVAGLCGAAEEYPWSSASGKWLVDDLG